MKFVLAPRIFAALAVFPALGFCDELGVAVQNRPTPNIYQQRVLNAWGTDLQVLLRKIMDEQIRPTLSSEDDKQALYEIVQNFNLSDGTDLGLFNEAADPKHKRIIVSCETVKFLADLIYIRQLEMLTPYRSFVPDMAYVAALKYRAPNEFPGGHFPTPFEAYLIPHDKDQLPYFYSGEVKRAFDLAYQGLLVFICAHECCHVLRYHHGEGQQALANEIEADAFAIDVLAKRHFSPSGLMLYFQLSSTYLPTPSDYPNTTAYESSLLENGHPTNAARIKAAGILVTAKAEQFSLGLKESERAQGLEIAMQLGPALITLADKTDQLVNQPAFRATFIEGDLSVYSPLDVPASDEGANGPEKSRNELWAAKALFTDIGNRLETLEKTNKLLLLSFNNGADQMLLSHLNNEKMELVALQGINLQTSQIWGVATGVASGSRSSPSMDEIVAFCGQLLGVLADQDTNVLGPMTSDGNFTLRLTRAIDSLAAAGRLDNAAAAQAKANVSPEAFRRTIALEKRALVAIISPLLVISH